MLFAVRRRFFYAFLICAVLATALLARGIPLHRMRRSEQRSAQQLLPRPAVLLQRATLLQQTAPPQQASPPQQNGPGAQGAAPTPAIPQEAAPIQAQPPAAPIRVGPVVVIDPGHGGTDTGARGEEGVEEKEVVLQFAKVLRSELERLGYRVVMTRSDDSNPSYDDRAAIANAYHDAIFVSLHVSSTGASGTARTYYYQFSQPLPAASSPEAGEEIPWVEEQRPFAEASRRLANLVQIELTHRFPASPNAPAPVAVRNLRSVAGAAIAVEMSSVSVSDPIALTSLAAPLATAVAKGVAAFRPIDEAKQP